MKDETFIESILQKGKEANDKIVSEFSGISEAQLNWKPSSESWSIAQCLDHLVVSDSFYFADLQKIIEGTYKMNFWERNSLLSAFWGQFMKNSLQEQVKKKMKAPRNLQPSKSEMKIDVIEGYLKNLNDFAALISKCRHIDLDKTIITSPVARIVT